LEADLKIVAVDGMGGSIGGQIIRRLRESLPDDLHVIALGTNAIAANNMMKAGANRGASGENAVIRSVEEADMIIGPISIVIPNSMMGELTAPMAVAIAGTKAQKILLPLANPQVDLVGVSKEPLPHLMEEAIEIIRKKMGLPEEVKKNV
jgi:hypothetical protein